MHGCERQHGSSPWRDEEMGQTWLNTSFSEEGRCQGKAPQMMVRGKTGVAYSVGIPNLRAGCLAFWQFLNSSLEFQTQERISHGTVPCGRHSVTVFDIQASRSFPTESPSGHAAVTGVASFPSHVGSLLSNEISLAGELTRSVIPCLDAFTKLFVSNYPWNLNFSGKFVQSCWRPGEEYTDVHTYVCIHSLPCRTASLHKCCFHGNKTKNTE